MLTWMLALALGQEASTPDRTVVLFNGRTLDGLRTWLRDSKGEDPGKVFSVVDGLLRCSGDGAGYIGTEGAWRDYRLVVEYRWGAKTDGSKTVRNSGILIHATGPDGGAGKGAWMPSLEVQLAQGCVGDLIPIRSKDVEVSFMGETAVGTDRRPRWSKGGTPALYTGRQFWWAKHEAGFQELLDTRGKDDVESPAGQWTKVELVCRGARVTVIVNGTTVNEIYDAKPAAGRILLQNEGYEVCFRTFELHPL
jgi:hypothetical protein